MITLKGLELYWIVKCNPPKTKSLLTIKQKSSDPVMMNGNIVEEVALHKHLGVTISRDLNWREHIENVSTSAAN